MPKLILFICGKTDLTADLVLLELRKRRNVEVVRLNVEDFPSKIEIAADNQPDKRYWSFVLSLQNPQKAMELTVKKGVKKLRVAVARKNILAQKFYRQLGFSPKEREYLLFEKTIKRG